MGTYGLIEGVASRDDLVDGFNRYPGRNYSGRTYYVNNITGDSGNNGFSAGWKNPMAQPSTAITAADAWRQRAAVETGNEYVRSTIYVQGTSTPYEEITELPSYCDLIGIGADPFGNGAGIVRIGADTGSGGGLTGTSSVRGLYMRGIQFQAGVSNYAFQMSNIFRSKIEHCAFATNGSPAGPPTSHFEIAIGSGLVMDDCHWLNQSAAGNDATVGFDVTGTHFHGCKVTNCFIGGSTAAVRIASGCINGFNSIFKNNYIGWGSQTCAIGVDDNATEGHIIYAGNYLFATDEYELTHNASRIIGFANAPS